MGDYGEGEIDRLRQTEAETETEEEGGRDGEREEMLA